MEMPRWRRVEAHFDAALARPASERAAYVAGIDDPEIAAEVASLLRASDSAAGFLEITDPPAGTLAPGERIGPWRVVRPLGAGGMGEVLEVERADGAFEQRAALKLVRIEAAHLLERFNAERRILAQLEHPGIARLLDGGVAPDGRPYAVMEYVDGLPITDWCRERGASLRERIALFFQVCDAVAYAHAHLIVHRDIKPANVLVDANGRARLLDFGIAKPLDAALPVAGSSAGTAVLLTPDYAAPEQLRGEAVGIATDVYALGVLLFELLVGARPWARRTGSLAELVTSVLDAPAPRPSEAALAKGDAPVPARGLRGDLDAIVTKCLRREPSRRYATVHELVRDLKSSLRGEAVLARGDARLYRLGRFARRYRWPLASVSLLIAVLSVGIATTTWQAQRAQREAARATATRDFLVSVFKASDPRIAQDKPRGQITARELLDGSVGRIDEQFADDRETQIELLGVATEIYRELREEERYEELHRRYLDMAREHYGEAHPIVLSAMLSEAGYVNERFLDREKALEIVERLDPLIHRAGLDDTTLRAHWWLQKGQALFGDSSRREESLAALRNAADMLARLAPTDPGRVTALAEIGTVYTNHRDFASARPYYDQAIAVAESIPDRNDAELATIWGNLGLLESNLGDFAAADRAYARSTEIIRRTYGEDHPDHWSRAANHARTVHLGGDRERANALFEELLRFIPPDSQHHNAFEAREWYGNCLAAEGRPLEALPLLEAAEQFYQRTAAFDFQLPRVRLALGDAYDRAGRKEEARRMLQAAFEHRVGTSAADSQVVFAARERWGRFLLEQGDLAGAEEQFREVVRHAGDQKLSHVALAHGDLARLALARGDLAGARGSSEAAVTMYEEITGFRDVRMGPYLWLIHSEVLRQSGDREGAYAWAQQALEARRRYDHPSSVSITEAEAAVGMAAPGGDTRRAGRGGG
jgi:serine/threonine-protein kinase